MPDLLETEDPLEVYQREVSKVPPLDAAEEARGLEHIRASDEVADLARERLVGAHLHRVVALAKVHDSERIHILELIEQGNRGLIAAVKESGQCRIASTCWDFAKTFVENSLRDLVVSRTSSR